MITCITLLLPALAPSAAVGKPSTPAQEYRVLLNQYNPASGALRKAKTDRQRKAAVENLGKFAHRFLDLAEKFPKDPVAWQAFRQAIQAVGSTDSAAQIAWETNRANFPADSLNGAAARIVKLLLRDHVRSNKLGPVIDRMRYAYRIEFEPFLDNVRQTNPHRNIRAAACLALARFLNDRLRMLQLVTDRPELANRYKILFGKNYLPAIRQATRGNRIETLFKQAAKFDDVKLRFGGTVAEQAKSELYELRHLSVGQTAPDIVGKDQDGKSFKLSDYRDKVVLLYFWMEF